jgi:tetratricopeptide (TPR) repeat protein
MTTEPTPSCVKLVFVLLILVTHAQAWAEGLPDVNAPIVIDTDMQFYRQRIAEAQSLFAAGRYARAHQVFPGLISDPRFGDIPESDKRLVLSAAAWSAVKNDRLDDARALYTRAIDLGSDDPDDFYRLSTIQFELGNLDASAKALTGLVERWPELLVNLDASLIYQLIFRTEHISQERLELMQALFYANWDGAGVSASSAWHQLALLHVERGDHEAARAVIRRIDGPNQLIALRSDRRFDALLDSDSWRANVQLAAMRQVERLRDHAASKADRLQPRVQLTYAMLTVGMHHEVIALVDEAIAAIATAANGAKPFIDIEEQVWLMNNRAIALRRLGRLDDALLELRRASHLGESGDVNVSQTLNLGQFYCKLGQPDAALAAISAAGSMSGYGKMVQTGVRHCAALQQQDVKAASEALAYLKKHRKDSQVIYLEALIAAGQLDHAAQVVIQLLDSPFERAELLTWMQEYMRPSPLPGEMRTLALRSELLARSDVQDTIERVGRIASYGVYGDYDM